MSNDKIESFVASHPFLALIGYIVLGVIVFPIVLLLCVPLMVYSWIIGRPMSFDDR